MCECRNRSFLNKVFSLFCFLLDISKNEPFFKFVGNEWKTDWYYQNHRVTIVILTIFAEQLELQLIFEATPISTVNRS